MVKRPLAEALPPTPLILTVAPEDRPWAAPVVTTIGMALVAFVTVPLDPVAISEAEIGERFEKLSNLSTKRTKAK